MSNLEQIVQKRINNHWMVGPVGVTIGDLIEMVEADIKKAGIVEPEFKIHREVVRLANISSGELRTVQSIISPKGSSVRNKYYPEKQKGIKDE